MIVALSSEPSRRFAWPGQLLHLVAQVARLQRLRRAQREVELLAEAAPRQVAQLDRHAQQRRELRVGARQLGAGLVQDRLHPLVELVGRRPRLLGICFFPDPLAQRGQRAQLKLLHGALAPAERRGDLRDRALLREAQLDHAPLVRQELRPTARYSRARASASSRSGSLGAGSRSTAAGSRRFARRARSTSAFAAIRSSHAENGAPRDS